MGRGSLDAISLGIFVVAALAINNVVCSLGSGITDRHAASGRWPLRRQH
jgi:hypothetical protein